MCVVHPHDSMHNRQFTSISDGGFRISFAAVSPSEESVFFSSFPETSTTALSLDSTLCTYCRSTRITHNTDVSPIVLGLLCVDVVPSATELELLCNAAKSPYKKGVACLVLLVRFPHIINDDKFSCISLHCFGTHEAVVLSKECRLVYELKFRDGC